MMTRSWRVWLVFLGVFTAGAVAGGFVALRFVARPAPQPDDLALRIMQRYSERLNLSEQQCRTIQPHVQRAAAEMHRTRAQVAEAMEALENAVEQQLGPEQRATLEEMQAEQRARWKKWMEKKREQERQGHRDGGDKPKKKPDSEA